MAIRLHGERKRPAERLYGALVACLVFGLAGCSGVADENIATAIADLDEAAQHFEAGADILKNDPKLAEAMKDWVLAWGDVQAARAALDGDLTESCDSRCKRECGGFDVVTCTLHCASGCPPHCCGCSDESGTCSHGCSNCNNNDGDAECAVAGEVWVMATREAPYYLSAVGPETRRLLFDAPDGAKAAALLNAAYDTDEWSAVPAE